MSSFDVRVFAIRRGPGRATVEVRWRVADRDKSRSFVTRALADSYRAELVRAARRALVFDPVTGEAAAWAAAEPVALTWYHHAVEYAEMKWPRHRSGKTGADFRRGAVAAAIGVAAPAGVLLQK